MRRIIGRSTMTRTKWILLGVVAWLACTALIAVMPWIRLWVLGDETAAGLPAAPAGLDPRDFYNRVYPRLALDLVGPQPAQSLAEASRSAGFQVLAPTSLPAGFILPQKVGLNTPAGYRMAVELDAARSLLAAAGIPANDLPPAARAEVLVTVQPVAGIQARSGEQWFSLLQGRPPLAGVPTGIRPQELDRLGVLGLRYLGLPEADAAALAARLGWAWFLAFPPGNLDRAAVTQVGGVSALELQSSSRAGSNSALIWENGGIIYGLYGGLPPENLRLMAESLR